VQGGREENGVGTGGGEVPRIAALRQISANERKLLLGKSQEARVKTGGGKQEGKRGGKKNHESQ